MQNIFKTLALIILVSCSSSASEISSDDTDLLPYQIINEKIHYIEEPELSDSLCLLEDGFLNLKLANQKYYEDRRDKPTTIITKCCK